MTGEHPVQGLEIRSVTSCQENGNNDLLISIQSSPNTFKA